MGKKKGKGKNKLSRMSEEERARYLQHRADMEEEARRRKQQLIALYMKNKLKREEAFTRLNMAKINHEWRFILRQIKCKELYDELKETERIFREAIERKNNMIRKLLCDLDGSEELYATMLHSHMETIDRLISLHRDRLYYYRENYYNEKRALLQRFDTEMKKYGERRAIGYEDLECITIGQEHETKRRQQVAEEDQLIKIDRIRNTMIIRLEIITSERENKMEELWKEFQNVLNKYVKTTEEYHNGYNDLRKRDDTDTKTIKIHYLEVANTTELINELKTNLDMIKEEHCMNMKSMQKYKNKLQDKYNELKIQLEMGQNLDKEQLKDLAVKSCFVIKKLKKNSKDGENLLQRAAISRKMETEMEKILPFGTKNKLFMLNEDESRLPPGKIESVTNEFLINEMENFWLRYNRAKVDCACLAEEKNSLKNENQQLKEQLRDYLTNVTLKNAGKRDERFLNRPHSMKIEKIVQIDISKVLLERYGKRRPVTCIEGNLSVAVRSRNLVMDKIKTPNIFS